MRHTFNRKPEAKTGDKRIRKGFLFFPKCIKGEHRWLERAEWEQMLVLSSRASPDSPHLVEYKNWINMSWKG